MPDEINSERVLELLDEVSHYNKTNWKVEGDWFMMEFEMEGGLYELGISPKESLIVLYDIDNEKELYRSK